MSGKNLQSVLFARRDGFEDLEAERRTANG